MATPPDAGAAPERSAPDAPRDLPGDTARLPDAPAPPDTAAPPPVDAAPPAPDMAMVPAFDSTGLVGYWRLDDGAGLTAHDSSGNGNDGTLLGYAAGGDWRPAGKLGGALGFSGAQWVNAAQNASLDSITSALSIVVWVWRDAGAGGILVHRQYQTTIYEHYQLGVGTDGRIRVWINNQNQSTNRNPICSGNPGPVNPGQWVHIALTYDGAQVRIYLNGQQVCSEPRTGGFSGYQRPLNLGAQLEHASDAEPIDFLGGQLDEVMLWSRALSPAEVQSLYAGAQPAAH